MTPVARESRNTLFHGSGFRREIHGGNICTSGGQRFHAKGSVKFLRRALPLTRVRLLRGIHVTSLRYYESGTSASFRKILVGRETTHDARGLGLIWQVGVSPHLRFRDVRSVLFLDQLPGLRVPFPTVYLVVPASQLGIPGVPELQRDLLPIPIPVKPVSLPLIVPLPVRLVPRIVFVTMGVSLHPGVPHYDHSLARSLWNISSASAFAILLLQAPGLPQTCPKSTPLW